MGVPPSYPFVLTQYYPFARSKYIPAQTTFRQLPDNLNYICSSNCLKVVFNLSVYIYCFSCENLVIFPWSQKPQRIAETRTVWTVWAGKAKFRTWFWRMPLVKLSKSFGHSHSRELSTRVDPDTLNILEHFDLQNPKQNKYQPLFDKHFYFSPTPHKSPQSAVFNEEY